MIVDAAARCDLLENMYLCGSNNNNRDEFDRLYPVVICLKICTFVVATTTLNQGRISLPLL